MKIHLALPGKPVDEKDRQPADPGVEQFLTVKTVLENTVQADARGGPEPTVDHGSADDEVLELTFSDGTKQWISATALHEDLAQAGQPVTRDGTIRVPSLFPSAPAERGVGDVVLKALKVLKIDPVATASDLTTIAVIDHFEKQVLPKQGLFRYTAPDKIGDPANELNATAPLLVFLHGTMSSTTGSFGKLAGTAEWTRLRDRYADRILAFEHATLSKSPIQNAIDLAQALPKNATLHLVSHSRGGLVGELLSLDPDQKAADLRAPFLDRAADAGAVTALMKLLADRRFKIERFVRVACPARGTTLASKRLDLYLSAMLNIIEFVPLAKDSFVVAFVKAVTLELARRRTDAKELPGIEAMMPTSPLVQMLNTVAKSTGDLAVIAGDAQGDGLLGKLKTLAIDAFFLAKNDYVVNTEAMYGGISRGDQPPLKIFDRGSAVNHFQYFTNTKTRKGMVSWLESGPDNPSAAGFERGFIPAFIKEGIDRLRPDAPAVFLLPGIMGSHIKIGTENIWINPAALASGGMGRMADLSQGGENGILNSFYGLLSTRLVRDFVVREFAYDWRNSIEKAAASLATEVKRELADRKGTIYFIAHSMGGLVVRMLIANHNDVWKDVTRRGGRVLMLGTPNAGSYAVPVTLAGQNSLVSVLAAVDFKNKEPQLREIIKGFPGLLELLPKNLFDPAEWKDKKDVVAIPDPSLLKSAAAVSDKLAKGVDQSAMVYVAGTGATANGWEFKDGKLQFTYAPGDGTVTYASGLLPGVLTRYVNASHGNLANHVPSFEGYIELLRTGTTNRLSESPISTRGVEAVPAGPPLSALFPTAEEIGAAALNATPPVEAPDAPTLIQVSVVHGDLRYATLPVAVGHYEEDSIVNAEDALDRALDGKLKRRYYLDLYPGKPGTNEVILAREANGLGALIIGLGKVGEVTVDKVRDGIAAVALRMALARLEATDETQPVQVAFGALLIGTFGGRNSLSVEQSVSAILQGAAQANRALRDRKLHQLVQITRIELIELYEDVALQTAEALDRLTEFLPEEDPDVRVEMSPRYLRSLEGAAYHRPADNYSTGWWRRVQITRSSASPSADLSDNQMLAMIKQARKDKSQDAVQSFVADLFNYSSQPQPPGCELKFLALTDRARAEERDQVIQTSLVDGLVKGAVSSTGANHDFGRTLFSLLIPQDFKRETAAQANLLLILDSGAAQYPWELLTTVRNGEPRPIAIEKGLIRQFRTTDYRPNPGSAPPNTALVIGDPLNDFFQLPGAKAEAEQVAETLTRDGYNVTKLINPGALQAVNGLLAGPYRLMHIAGHGYYDPDEPVNSGVLLKDGSKITPAEIQALDPVPELVFLNCCHLGQVDSKVDTKVAFHKLAASVSEELIKIGVRAVVAAGWAVNDAAAATFAQVFYDAMLDGQSFGEAVRKARKTTYLRHPGTNTWGAYQCYGFPDFTLVGLPTREHDQSDVAYSESQRRNRLRTLASRSARLDNEDDKEKTAKALDGILDAMPDRWKQGEMLTSIADVWSELGKRDRAISLYKLALQTEKATAPYRAEEQLVNQLARAAEKLAAKDRPKAEEMFAEADARIRRLVEYAGTVERWSLKGSLEKRRANVATRAAERKAHLKRCGEAYRYAYQRARATGGSLLYPGMNHATCSYLGGDLKEGLNDLIADIRGSVQQFAAVDQDVWVRAFEPDSMLLVHLAKGDLKAQKGAVVKAYQDVFKSGMTDRERDSVLGQMRFLIKMLNGLGRKDDAELIDEILANFEKRDPAPSAPAPAVKKRKAPKKKSRR